MTDHDVDRSESAVLCASERGCFPPGLHLTQPFSPVPPDPGTWIAALGSLPLLAQPGERWMYNTGAQVLGVLAARAAGQPFSEVLKTRILEPLGMRDTGSSRPCA